MLNSDSELLIAIQSASRTLSKTLSEYKLLAKALEKLEDAKSLDRQDYVGEALEQLKQNDLAPLGCGEHQSDMIEALTNRLRDLRANAHHDMVVGLTKGMSEKPEQMKVLSDIPLVIYLHPLTLEVQFEQKKSVLTYAHEVLATTSLDPDEILKTRAELLDAFRASRIDSARFWDICRMAYEMVLLKNGQASGSRVDIVELLPPLGWLWPNTSAFKKNAPFPKYLLAYQLQKLRSDRMLEHQKMRLDLGTATGGSTKNKANVIYIPMGTSEGQYYLSICFRLS